MSTNFIDCSENEQAKEIRDFLKSLGAEIESHDDPSEVTDIISNCNVVWKLESVNDIEAVINSVISLLLLLPEEVLKPKIDEFCEQVVNDATDAHKLVLCLKILTGFFHALSENSSLRYPVYMSMLKCAKSTSHLQMVDTDLSSLRSWRSFWKLTDPQWQSLLRLLHETLVQCKEGSLAGKTMYELLSSYSGDKADEARDDSIMCVAAELKNPNVYLFDHLLNLKPVQNLKGTKVYELLEIFVSGGLVEFQQFEKSNTQFFTDNAFDLTELNRKIRLLTFATIALECKEIEFAVLGEKLQISNDEIEEFVIEAIRSKVIKAKIDQLNDKVIVTSVTQRTFTTNEWKQLHATLLQWKSNIDGVNRQIASVSMDLSNPL
jgi:translation initiation factor 3 subunit M